MDATIQNNEKVVKNIKLERRELIGETVDKELYKMQ
jgi:hypothetical protein